MPGSRTPTSPRSTQASRALAREALTRILAGRTSGTVLVVTHGGAIGTLLRSLFGGHHVAVLTANTGVMQLNWERNHWRLEFHNNTAHLESLTAPRAPASAPTPAPWTNGQNAPAIIKHYRRVASAKGAASSLGERELRELVRLANPGGQEQVLDVATGAGAVALAFAPHVEFVLGIDLSPAMLELAESARSARGLANVRFSLGEIGVLPLPDSGFDLITVHDLLSYVVDPPALSRCSGGCSAQAGG